MTREPTAERISAIARRARGLLARGVSELGEAETRELLDGVLPFGRHRLVRTADEAAAAAASIGYPVVVKALTPQVLHKSDLGLVTTGIQDPAELDAAVRRMLERVDAPEDTADWSLSVQAQLSGAEFAVGVRRNELGAFCVVAAGGVLIEILDDSAVAAAPVDRDTALALVDGLRLGPLLQGYRGSPPLDRAALADLVAGVSELAYGLPELAELDLNPVFVGARGAYAADGRCVLAPARPGERDRRLDGAAVRAILRPAGVAVVGGSRDTRKPGGLLLRYLRKHGHRGDLVAVNPRDLELDDVPTYPSLTAVREPIDLACIAVRAGEVRAAIEDCVRSDVRAGIVYASGFAESGADGARAQRELLDAAAGRFRFLGPNSIGAASPAARMFATFGMVLEGPLPPLGRVALVSQSGAIASSIISRSREFGVGLSQWISTGNEADLDVADCVDHLAGDPDTTVICLFLEVIRRPAAFAAACRRAHEAGKTVIAVKTGRSAAGRAAAASHTGAMTGADRTYDAFFHRCHVLRVAGLADLFPAAQGALLAGESRGSRVGIISMSGGACSILADGCHEAGLRVPELPRATQAALAGSLPAFAGVRNPVDVTAQGIGSPELVVSTLKLVRASGAVDLVLLQLSTNADPGAEAMARDLAAARGSSEVPFLVGRLGAASLAPRALKIYRDAGMHVFVWPEQLVQAARAAAWSGRRRHR